MGEHENALKKFQEALDIQTAVLSENHPDFSLVHINIGMCLVQKNELNELNEAVGHFDESSRILRALHGDEHPKLLSTYRNLADVHEKLGNSVDAEKYKALLYNISWYYQNMNKDDCALGYFLKNDPHINVVNEINWSG